MYGLSFIYRDTDEVATTETRGESNTLTRVERNSSSFDVESEQVRFGASVYF